MKRIVCFLLIFIVSMLIFSCSSLEEPKSTETATHTAENTDERINENTPDIPDSKTEEKALEKIILPNVMCRVTKGIDWLEKSVKKFETEEIKEGCIMFYGSSLFTRWTGDPSYHLPHAKNYLADDIKAKDGTKIAVNHGFGTSSLHELCYYYERAVRPWKPKAIVICEYGNTKGCGYSLDEMLVFFDWLCTQAKKDFPEIKIFVISPMPNKNADGDEKSAYLKKDYTDMLKQYASDKKFVTVIESHLWEFLYNDKASVGTYKNINADMFCEDKKHFSEKGYEHFAEEIIKAIDEVL